MKPRSVGYIGLGASQFFVIPEPGIADAALLIAIVSVVSVRNLRFTPSEISFMAAHMAVFVLALVAPLDGTGKWALITWYLLTAFWAIKSLVRNDPSFLRLLTIGAAIGMLANLGLLAVAPDLIDYSPGRFTGFFKDPNVLGPTALAFVLLAQAFGWRLRALVTVSGIVLILASSSRASLLGLFVGFAWFLPPLFVLTVALLAGSLVLFYSSLDGVEDFLTSALLLIGRQGVIESHDADRFSNWTALSEVFLRFPWGHGPLYAAGQGLAPHSLWVGWLVECGVISFVMLIIPILVWAMRCKRANPAVSAAVIALLANATFIDPFHWRILYIVLGIAAAAAISHSRATVQ